MITWWSTSIQHFHKLSSFVYHLLTLVLTTYIVHTQSMCPSNFLLHVHSSHHGYYWCLVHLTTASLMAVEVEHSAQPGSSRGAIHPLPHSSFFRHQLLMPVLTTYPLICMNISHYLCHSTWDFRDTNLASYQCLPHLAFKNHTQKGLLVLFMLITLSLRGSPVLQALSPSFDFWSIPNDWQSFPHAIWPTHLEVSYMHPAGVGE